MGRASAQALRARILAILEAAGEALPERDLFARLAEDGRGEAPSRELVRYHLRALRRAAHVERQAVERSRDVLTPWGNWKTLRIVVDGYRRRQPA